MTRGPDVGMLVERALVRHAASAGVTLEIVAARMRPWASVTFSGARHLVMVRAEAGDAAERWLSGLTEAELAVAGHLVADAAVGARHDVDGRIEVEIEMLSVEER